MFNIYRYNKYLVCYNPTKSLIRYLSKIEGQLAGIGLHFDAKSKSVEEWDEKLNKLMKINKVKTQQVIMDICYDRKNLDLASSFLEYIRKRHIRELPLAKAHYLRMLTSDINNKDSYLYLRNDIITHNNVSSLVHSVIRKADNEAGKRNFGYGFGFSGLSFDEIIKTKGLLAAVQGYSGGNIHDLVVKHTDIIISMMEKDENKIRTKATLKILLQNYSYTNAPLKYEVYYRIINYLRNNRIKYRTVEMLNSEPCSNCHHSLRVPIKPSEDDVEILKNAVENEIIKGENIFYKTNPTEWKMFKQFLEINGKFDAVIDGLNFSHDPENVKNKKLIQDVQNLGSKFLFIGRMHAHKAIERSALSINKEYKVFYPDKVSKDDLFVIYAALWSGLDTKFVSNDIMRDHKKFSNDSLVKLFLSWQKYHQMLIPNEQKQLARCSLYNHVTHYDGENIFHITPERTRRLFPECKWTCLELKVPFDKCPM